MSGLRFMLSVVMMLCMWIPANAQKGLNVAPFFSEDYSRNPNVVMVSMSGLYDEIHGIKIYQSITVTGDVALCGKIARAVSKDGSRASKKEVKYKEGKLYFGFYFLGGSGERRRYLLYLDRMLDGGDKVVLMYIEGDLSFDAVKDMLRK